jgi:hypothetical protein
LSDFQGILISS